MVTKAELEKIIKRDLHDRKETNASHLKVSKIIKPLNYEKMQNVLDVIIIAPLDEVNNMPIVYRLERIGFDQSTYDKSRRNWWIDTYEFDGEKYRCVKWNDKSLRIYDDEVAETIAKELKRKHPVFVFYSNHHAAQEFKGYKIKTTPHRK